MCGLATKHYYGHGVRVKLVQIAIHRTRNSFIHNASLCIQIVSRAGCTTRSGVEYHFEQRFLAMLSAKGHRRQPNPDHCRRVMIKVSTCFALVRQEDILEALRCHEGSGRPDDDRDDAMRPRSTVWPPCVRDNPSLTFNCDRPEA